MTVARSEPIRPKLRQFVLGATDLEIDFQKLVCNVGDNGFKLACTNEVAINKKKVMMTKGVRVKIELELTWTKRA